MTTINYFITGTNKGIGFTFVEQLSARKNVKIFATVRDPSNAPELQELSRKTGNIEIVKLIPGSKESIETIPAYLEKHAPEGIDYYIGNAGFSPPMSNIIDLEYDQIIDLYKVNVFANLFILKALLPSLKKKSSKKVVFISSRAGSLTVPTHMKAGAYSSSKSALNKVTQVLGHELSEDGITVIALHPGVVRTPGAHKLMGDQLEVVAETYGMLTQEESVEQQLKTIDSLKFEQSGKFYDYNGDEAPW